MAVAERHEASLIWASNPALFALLQVGKVMGASSPRSEARLGGHGSSDRATPSG
jgi:hypothetical protein